MLVSVIIPVYNGGKYLRQCLDTVIFQTYKNLEVIIINDGSTDDSVEILNEYAASDKRFKIIEQKNQGQSVARNNGLNIATGEYIHFLDCDDFIDLDYYEKMIKAAEVAPGSDIVAGGTAIWQFGQTHKYSSMTLLVDTKEKFRITGALRIPTIWRYLFRREFLHSRNLKFQEGWIFEDVLFIPNAILWANRIVTVPDTFYHYIPRPSSTIQSLSAAREEQMVAAVLEKNKFIVQHGLMDLFDGKSNPLEPKKSMFRNGTVNNLTGIVPNLDRMMKEPGK